MCIHVLKHLENIEKTVMSLLNTINSKERNKRIELTAEEKEKWMYIDDSIFPCDKENIAKIWEEMKEEFNKQYGE